MRAWFLAAALLALAPLASAQTATNDLLGPCSADAARLCADVAAGQGAKMKCLSSHEADLGPECKERMTAVKARMKELVGEIENLCGADGKRLCPDRAVGSGLLPCLAEHEKDISPQCRDWLEAHRAHGGGSAP